MHLVAVFLLPLNSLLAQFLFRERKQNMKLNIYKNQKEVEKTYQVDNYDLMFGTVEDILGIFDEIDDMGDNMQIFNAIRHNRSKLNALLKDIFPELTDDELRRTKLFELVPVFIGLFGYVKASLGDEKN